MIHSLRSYPDGSEFATDLCVIGAGPTGMALAREFLQSGLRVLMVESGGEAPEADAQALNGGDVTGAPYRSLEDGRVRAFGGTSWIWAGQILPLGPEAFARRPWAPDTRWPIEQGELTSYYDRAAGFFRLDPRSWSEDFRSAFGITVPQFDDSVLGTRGGVWMDEPRLGPRYMTEFRRARRLTVLLNASVVGLRLSSSGQAVTDAEIGTLNRTRGRVRAKAFVLAAGGIENARLLMTCPGLSDRLPALGRYFQDHPAGVCARVEPKDRLQLQDLFAFSRRRGRRHTLRLRLTGEAQKRAQVLACEGTVIWPQPLGVSALHRLAAGGHRPKAVVDDLSTVLRDAREVLSAARRYRRRLSAAPADAPLTLALLCEQAPNPDSRLTLAGGHDALGVPRVCVDWQIGEIERRTMMTMVDAVAAEFSRLGLGALQRERWLDHPEAWRYQVHDFYHPSGATRMGAAATDSVVDTHCRIHGLDNGFVAGSSAFPAVGAANPTLTIVALAIRLADRLKTSVLA